MSFSNCKDTRADRIGCSGCKVTACLVPKASRALEKQVCRGKQQPRACKKTMQLLLGSHAQPGLGSGKDGCMGLRCLASMPLTGGSQCQELTGAPGYLVQAAAVHASPTAVKGDPFPPISLHGLLLWAVTCQRCSKNLLVSRHHAFIKAVHAGSKQ